MHNVDLSGCACVQEIAHYYYGRFVNWYHNYNIWYTLMIMEIFIFKDRWKTKNHKIIFAVLHRFHAIPITDISSYLHWHHIYSGDSFKYHTRELSKLNETNLHSKKKCGKLKQKKIITITYMENGFFFSIACKHFELSMTKLFDWRMRRTSA